MFQNRVAVVTGAAQGIGQAIAAAFRAAGAHVCIIDRQPNEYFTGDLAQPAVLEAFAQKVIREHGRVDFLIHNAPPLMKGLDHCSYAEFLNALQVGVAAPFYLTKLFAPYFGRDAAVVNISSSRDRMSQPQTESYSAAKGGISALTHALAVSLAGRARVNAISPGWIETSGACHSGPDASQHPVGRVGEPRDIARLALFLCSPDAAFISGENICVDGGMTHLMIYHGDCGWTLQPEKSE